MESQFVYIERLRLTGDDARERTKALTYLHNNGFRCILDGPKRLGLSEFSDTEFELIGERECTEPDQITPCVHLWVTKRQGGDPAELGSYEYVKVCEVCGGEDTEC